MVQAATVPVLTSVRVTGVKVGDSLDVFGAPRTVLDVVRGQNRQVYLVTKTEAGAPIVSEHDRTESVSVWREQRALLRSVDVTPVLAGADV